VRRHYLFYTSHNLIHLVGAAVATMTGALIKTSVDPSVSVTVSGFGLPRGGNQAWADFLDNQVRLPFSPSNTRSFIGLFQQVGVTFMTNQNDPVPTVPPRFLGFAHSSGEIHIVDDTQKNFVACPGQDNTNCATGNSVLSVSVSNHKGNKHAHAQNVFEANVILI
jgi:hypothetical protein